MFETILLVAYLYTDAPIDVLPCMVEPLRDAAVAVEVLDADAARTWWFRPHELHHTSDLRTIRNWVRESRSYPRLGWVESLPSREAVEDALAWNRDYCERLRECLRLHDAFDQPDIEGIEQSLTRAEAARFVWGLADDARRPHGHPVYRRECLHKLRKLLGPERFYNGILPPPVPLRETPWLTLRHYNP